MGLTYVLANANASPAYKNKLWSPQALVALIGFIRTVFAGLWIFIPSVDNNTYHEYSIIGYVILSGIYMFASAPLIPKTRALKTGFGWVLTSALGGLVYQFYRHKVLHIAGAYSIYSLIEWPMIFVDGISKNNYRWI